jgi:hypothetical protein
MIDFVCTAPHEAGDSRGRLRSPVFVFGKLSGRLRPEAPSQSATNQRLVSEASTSDWIWKREETW